jgi:hypothetical protein
VRVRDFYAWSLRQVEGMPPFQPYWPQRERDRAIAAIVAFVQEYPSR